MVNHSVHIDMSGGSELGFLNISIMTFSVNGMYGIEILGLVTGFRDGNGLVRLVNGRVGGLKPG